MVVFFIVEDFFTHTNPTTKEIFKFIISAIVAGTISGLLFGWLIGRFVNSKFVNETTKITIDADEKMIFQTGANHFKGWEGVGGKLYLTDHRLIFKSHKLNIQNHELIIKLSDIKKIDRFKLLGFTNNGLSIITNEQSKEKFVVEQIEKWLLYLGETSKEIIPT